MFSERFPKAFLYQYVVTNWHVAVRSKNRVVRANSKDGPPYIIKIDDWYSDERFDIAIAPYPANIPDLDCSIIPPAFFVTPEGIATHSLGPGEDVFMVGRFVDHDGGETNRPAVRFGNISVMPTPLEQPNNVLADAFVIDMHSRPGYSGSPVFVFRTPGYDLEERLGQGAEQSLLLSGVNFLGLLGIHYDQFPEAWPIIGKFGEISPVKHDGPIIRGLSGMTKVLPAWSILEVLNMPGLKDIRDKLDDEHEQRLAMQGTGEATGASPKQEETPSESSSSSPDQRADFTASLGAAENPRSQED